MGSGHAQRLKTREAGILFRVQAASVFESRKENKAGVRRNKNRGRSVFPHWSQGPTESMRRSRGQFEALMLPHLDAAYNLACWLLRDVHEAEDAVQEAYLKAYAALPQYRGGNSAAWLLKIVRNTCLTMLRRRKARSNVIVLREALSDDDPLLRTALGDAADAPERLVIAKAEQEAVRSALAGLPEHYREIVVLREFEELSYQEIAEVTQLPIGTVMSRLSRARRALRDALTESGEGDERSTL